MEPFIGTKMLLSPSIHLPVTLSLAVIAVVVGTAVTASLWRDRAGTRRIDPIHRIDRIDQPNEPVRE